MQTIFIIWLILGGLASIFVMAALMLSSRISQDEGLVENYDEWESSEAAPNVIPQQAEQ